MTTSPYWVTAFLDLPRGDLDRALEFWSGVTGHPVSPRRGAHDEFVSLLPPDGDDYLDLQATADGDGRLHLDLHVENTTVAAEAAIELGAHVLVRHEEGYVVLRSPGGFVFCFVTHPASRRPGPTSWPGGRSMVDQVCLDIPPSAYDGEVEFWRALTGWTLDPDVSREFARLEPPDSQPLRWLIQRLDDEAGSVRAHLDVAAEDREAEIARHVALGATVVSTHDWWTVLTDPVGTTYCITRRSPR